MKLAPRHIQEQWDEGQDGYWISLKPGWKWAGDPIGNVHVIHEPTKQSAFRESIMPCQCLDCKKARSA